MSVPVPVPGGAATAAIRPGALAQADMAEQELEQTRLRGGSTPRALRARPSKKPRPPWRRQRHALRQLVKTPPPPAARLCPGRPLVDLLLSQRCALDARHSHRNCGSGRATGTARLLFDAHRLWRLPDIDPSKIRNQQILGIWHAFW